MAKITITLPDEHIDRIQDAFASAYGHTDAEAEDAKESRGAFLRDKIREFVVGVVVNHEAGEAGRKAEIAARQQAAKELG